MIQKSIKISIQRLLTFKAYSLINILGLAIALSVCLAILLYTTHHFSFDRFVPDAENCYRITTRYGDGSYSTNTFASFDDVLSDFPEVMSHTLCFDNHNVEDVFVGENKIKANEAIFANDSFMDFFGLKMIEGDRESINEPNTMMLSPEMALRLFPDEEALGQIVLLRSFTANQDSLIAYTVTGIVEPLPETSHLKFEMLLSQKGHFSPSVQALKSRKVFGGLIYVRLSSTANTSALEKSLQTVLEPVLGGVHGPPLDALNHKLQPVLDIHFTQGLNNEKQATVRRSSMNILLLVGFLIFVIAILNSVIMHIARSAFNRTATLIIRFHGGTKMDLFFQTYIEVFISLSLSFVLTLFFLSTIEFFLPDQFFANWAISFHSCMFWVYAISLFLGISIIISFLSSINLLRDEPIQREANQSKGMKAAIPLVIFQFVMVIALSAFALLVNKQMNFIEHKDLGYSPENVLVIKVPQRNEKVNTLREELLKIPGIINAGTAFHYPGYRLQDMNLSAGGNSFFFKFGHINHDAIEVLQIEALTYFTQAKEQAADGWLINETFYKHLSAQYSDEQIANGDFSRGDDTPSEDEFSDFVVLGVVRDFHYSSLHSEIENFAFYIPDPNARAMRFVLARIRQNNSREIIVAVENIMDEIYPGRPINYSFLDDELNVAYTSEAVLLRLINAFSVLAIFIAILGLLGLSVFMTERRSKEIGIRKVNGASVLEIMQMLIIVFLKWLGLAFIIATPIAWYAAQKWLQSFAYKTELSWWIFVLAGMAAALIVLITVSWQTFKVARRNPVEALRYE